MQVEFEGSVIVAKVAEGTGDFRDTVMLKLTVCKHVGSEKFIIDPTK